jgi:hypothetical protein
MAAIETKEGLLERLRQERRHWESILAEVGKERMEIAHSLDEWTFKDTVIHLTTWWRRNVAILAEVRRAERPTDHPSQRDVQVINRWMFHINRDRPLEDVLHDEAGVWHEFEAALKGFDAKALMEPGRYAWLDGQALGTYALDDFVKHLHEEHEPAIREWLAGLAGSR